MDRPEIFNEHRRLLFSLAYRMLGSVADAEDMVQEAFLRWQAADAEEIKAPKAYLSTIVTNLCINHLTSARVKREEYVGPWLPEPLITDESQDPMRNIQMADSLSMAFMVLLESLTPTERACFLLREVFDYEYEEIARMLGKTEANCRQMVSRARLHIRERRPRFDVSSETRARLTGQFMQACASGDLQGLMSLLAEDATLTSDGGGRVTAARKPIHGADHIARFLTGLVKKAGPGRLSIRPMLVNGQPGFITYWDDRLVNVLSLDIADNQIRAVYIVVNPDKLRGLTSHQD
ncbi:MAG TPA: sigma-70 family RNA polymerase sigma factor [Pyrinomonadaceae bacterium]|nr:sigma-70 family RNA polymerase sigma factor [Pyrinomonadaceae bacterium]